MVLVSLPNRENLELFRVELASGRTRFDVDNGGTAVGAQSLTRPRQSRVRNEDGSSEQQTAIHQRRRREKRSLRHGISEQSLFSSIPTSLELVPNHVRLFRCALVDSSFVAFNGRRSLPHWTNDPAPSAARQHFVQV
ncbi:hypothetical protein LSTR_LSTR015074 [Laodelphax striatellus]|uniref:Uncharacterized protein n=1 Tax=Laodelphax striatellus TaxID=195883 RepID=A0A482X190_LAOST|nr:hypothetical protein LSTR_LSTR015074 [Laodelphax striatellus]